jgi:photosystem II stability/assembly factor-like uncharacterized protein
VLGVLLGTDEGLLQVLPGESPEHPVRGARVTSLDYFDGLGIAGSSSGVWVHAGRRWEQRWEGDARSVRVSPEHQLYIGTEPARMLVSGDRGQSWSEYESLRHVVKHHDFPAPAGHKSPYVSGFAFPREGLLVAIGGGGTWFTRDEGKSWLRRGEGLDPTVHVVHEHPEERDRLFATADSGFYRSEDAGFSWLQSLGGLDRSWGCGFAVVPAAPDRIVLSVARRAPGQDGALFRSANGGVTWNRLMLDDEDEWEQGPVVTRPWNFEEQLFLAAGDKVWASHDGGRNWLALVEGLPAAHAIAVAL